jgi:hypothetical protein
MSSYYMDMDERRENQILLPQLIVVIMNAFFFLNQLAAGDGAKWTSMFHFLSYQGCDPVRDADI